MRSTERVACATSTPRWPNLSHWAFPSPLQPNAAEAAFDLPRAFDAVVRLAARIPDDAFTAPILGTEREGNGVVIRDNGLIVTVGYLITEARRDLDHDQRRPRRAGAPARL